MSTMRDEKIEDLRDRYSMRSLRFHPSWAGVFGGINPALMLCQLLYWMPSTTYRQRGSLWKTVPEMTLETALSKGQQSRARKKLVDLGVVETWLGGVPRRRHYRVHLERVEEILREKYGERMEIDDNGGINDLPIEYIDQDRQAREEALSA